MRNDNFYERRRFAKKKSKDRSKKSNSSYSAPRNYSFGDFLSDAGNLKMQNFFESGMVQAKLNVSQPGDMYEKEADRIAKAIVKGKPIQTPHVNTVMTKAHSHNSSVNNNTESKIKAIKGRGNPLNRPVRDYFEPRFGVDLGNVRVHTDSNANLLAKSINARAFTYGNDIVFGGGQYQPGTSTGKELLAHELAHTMQQSNGLQRDVVQKKEPNYSTRNFRYMYHHGDEVDLRKTIEIYKRDQSFRDRVYSKALANGETSEVSPYSGTHIGTIALIAGEGHPDSKYAPVREVYESTCQIEYIQLFDRTEQEWIDFFNGDYNSIKTWEINAYMAAAIGNINLLTSDSANEMAYNELPSQWASNHYQIFDYLEYVHYIKELDSDFDIDAGSKVFLKAMLMSKNLQLDNDYRHYLHGGLSFIDIFQAFCDKYLYDVIKDLSLEELKQIEIDRFLRESVSGKGYLKIIEACSRDVENKYRNVVIRCNEHSDAAQSVSNEQFHLETIRYVSEIQELGLLIGTSIRKIKDLGLERLDTVSDAISVGASIIATIVGGPIAAGVAILIGLASDHYSEEESVIQLFTGDEKSANNQFPANANTPRKKLEAIHRLIKRYIANPSEQQLNDPSTVPYAGWSISAFMEGIYCGRLGERPKP